MASGGREGASILRTLYRELRPTVNQPQTNVYQTQLWKHIVGLCKSCKIQSSAKVKEAQRNLEDTGRLYILYLQSSKEYHRISDLYKGSGERTAEDTARMLGFKMPSDPKNDSSCNSATSKLRARDTPPGGESRNNVNISRSSSHEPTTHFSPIQ